MTAENTPYEKPPLTRAAYDWWVRQFGWMPQRVRREPDPPNVTVPQWLVDSARAAAWIAMFVLVYFLAIFTLDIAGDQAVPLHLTHAGSWVGDFLFYLPLIIGFAGIAVGVPFMAKIIIPIFISLDWRTNLWPKVWSLVLVLAFSFVVFAGTFSVQGKTILEHGRESAVAVAEVNQGRAALGANTASIQRDIDDIAVTASAHPTYQMQACRDGAEAWARRVAAAREQRDYQLPSIERAQTSAKRCDDLRGERRAAMQAEAAAPVVESVQANVATAGTNWIASTLDWLVGARAILLSLVMDVVCLLMPWIALRLEQTRNRQLGMAEGIPQHPWMIEDQRGTEIANDPEGVNAAYAVLDAGGSRAEAAEAARAAVRVTPPRRKFTDADTGEEVEEVRVKAREHWRKLKRGTRVQVETVPEGATSLGPQNTRRVQNDDGTVTEIEPGVATGTGDERGSVERVSNNAGLSSSPDALAALDFVSEAGEQLKHEPQRSEGAEKAETGNGNAADEVENTSHSDSIPLPDLTITDADLNDPEVQAMLGATAEDIGNEQHDGANLNASLADARDDRQDPPADTGIIEHQPASTAVIPQGFVFADEIEDEPQHNAHMRERELELEGAK